MSLGLLTGCYNQDKFTTDFAQATCDWWDRCDLLEVLAYEDVPDCVDETESEAIDGQGEDGLCPGFNSSAAKDCIAAMNERGCEEGFDTPSVCEEACSEEG
jgi:hypothetical protein